MNTVFLHLGSNKNVPLRQILRAYIAIEQEIGSISLYSQFYKTAAWGNEAQDDFINTAISVITTLSAENLLAKVLDIELQLGRERHEKWGPRIIDIDIIFYNNELIKTEQLVIPHPHMAERNFVLIPLMEIAGEFIHPELNITIEDLYLNSRDTKNVILL